MILRTLPACHPLIVTASKNIFKQTDYLLAHDAVARLQVIIVEPLDTLNVYIMLATFAAVPATPPYVYPVAPNDGQAPVTPASLQIVVPAAGALTDAV